MGSTGNTTDVGLHFELRCENTLLAPTLYLPYTETVPALAAEQGILLPAMTEDPAIANAIARRAIGSPAPQTFSYPLPESSPVTVGYIADNHEALDLKQPEGTDVTAMGDGLVLFAGWDDNYGWTVVIGHGNNSDGQSLITLYAHMQSRPSVLMGQLVSDGQVIGQVGTTGLSTGPHLHIGVMLDGVPVDPQPLLQ